MEKHSEFRHEYVDGRVLAMAGASDVHEIIAMNVAAAIHNHLDGKRCRVFKSDLKVRLQINKKDIFYYPDIMVACDPADNHRFYRDRPSVIIEILSENEDKDLIEKYLAYQTIGSLEEYIVLSQDPENRVAYVHRKSANWVQEKLMEGDLEIQSIGFKMSLANIYKGVEIS